MKVLLTHGYFLEEDEKEKVIMRPYPPLGLLYISAYLDQHKITNAVFDTTFSSKKEFYNCLKIEKPTVIGLYANLMTKINIIEIIQFIRENIQSTVILGGPDVRYNAEHYLKAGADYLVVGEGEQTMCELVNYFQQQKGDVNSIHGIAYLRDGNVVFTSEREKLKELDLLPFPNREKIDIQKYLDAWKKHHGKSAFSVSTMRGCPYTCKWCSRAVYGLSYRRRSPEKVVEELTQIQQLYNPDTLWFVDDVFTISHKWLESFKLSLKKSGLQISYECITRADRMNEEVIKTLKETGCFRVWIGAESGSQKIIDLMDRRVDVKQVREMIRLSKKYGIETGTFIMLGYPGETEEDIEETIQHLKESDPDHFTITVAYPIAGTELFQEVEISSNELYWNTSTDRQVDFKRTYSRKYYDYAVRRVISEVNASNKARFSLMKRMKFKAQSLAAKTMMTLTA